ncbi:MAG: 3-ketoacyl-ACP synthase [Flammeovirgaceae bacterium]|nr:3-ketoacyl-ACP synthase [Flammeovirgaceae bacterium]MBE61879.1 3-ketoacyl-ACP synthase [Flammeovirgaceae bacterium]MBR10604.1 3-ketoacyl-ACP synthase [Rickettsiales bacterium]HCX23186.1 ketoacyl-ACP synthase III [Cytophagales bacterium]|tara:strand:+ start:2660 stop:3646 length:987 start_codon:yes stop_codon:yes gene_type:complete
MRRAAITGIGAYAPDQEIPNSYFNETLGQDVDAWLRENVNITTRRWCTEDESVADLCEQAAKEAIADAGVKPEDINLIIVSTDTPEYISPSTASVLQDRLGLKNAGTFDLNTACAGFVTAMDVASKYIASDERYQHVLVLGGYAMSKYLNKEDKKTVTLFADGAGAIVMSATDQDKGLITSDLKTEGQYNGWMGIYGGATKMPITEAVLENHDHQLKFVHKFPKELNPKMWTEMANDICDRLGVKPQDVDHFFITQLNFNSINETMDNLNVDRSKAHMVMDQYGYTGSACIPMALHDAYKKGKVKEGDLSIFIGSGGGLAFAAAAVRF